MSQLDRIKRLQSSLADLPNQELHNRTWNRQSNETRRECEPTFSMERQVAEARALIGEEAWAKYQAEWEPQR